MIEGLAPFMPQSTLSKMLHCSSRFRRESSKMSGITAHQSMLSILHLDPRACHTNGNSRSIKQNNTVVDIFNTWNLPKSQAEHAAGSSLSRPPFQCAASRVWVLGRLAHLNGWPPHPIGGTALQPGSWATLGTSASKARGKAVPRGRWARLAMSVKAV